MFCCVSLRFCETHLLLELQVVGVENERWKCKEHFAYTTRRCWRLNAMAWDFLPVAQVLNNSPASDIERQWMLIPWSIYSPILGGEFKDFLNRNLGNFFLLWLVFLSWNSPRISWFPLGCNCDTEHVCFTSRVVHSGAEGQTMSSQRCMTSTLQIWQVTTPNPRKDIRLNIGGCWCWPSKLGGTKQKYFQNPQEILWSNLYKNHQPQIRGV